MRALQVQRAHSDWNNFFSDFDRMFDGIGAWNAPALNANAGFVPAYEFNETDQSYLLSFDVPGVPKDAIKVELKDRQLKVSGERRQAEKKADGNRTYSERRYGQFERSFSLPQDVDVENIEANHVDGVLQLMLPKVAKTQPKTIKIGSNESAGFFNGFIGRGKSTDETKG